MPVSPKRACTYPGCNALVSGGRCAAHRREERPTRVQRGYDAAWGRFAKEYLVQHPICAIRTHCHGALATDVDHIVRLREAPHRKYDPTNLQPACSTCHKAKSGRESALLRGERME